MLPILVLTLLKICGQCFINWYDEQYALWQADKQAAQNEKAAAEAAKQAARDKRAAAQAAKQAAQQEGAKKRAAVKAAKQATTEAEKKAAREEKAKERAAVKATKQAEQEAAKKAAREEKAKEKAAAREEQDKEKAKEKAAKQAAAEAAKQVAQEEKAKKKAEEKAKKEARALIQWYHEWATVTRDSAEAAAADLNTAREALGHAHAELVRAQEQAASLEHWIVTASLDQQVVEANVNLHICASRHVACPTVGSLGIFNHAYEEFYGRRQTAEEHRNLVQRKITELETATANMRLAMEPIRATAEAAAEADASYLSLIVEHVAGLAEEAEGEAEFSELEGTPD